MRTPGYKVVLSLVVAAVVACGGFENGPLQSGTVRGRIVGAEPDVAVVSVMGQPGLRTGVDADGRFELAGVPATPLELFVVATRTRAALTQVVAQGARITDVGDIQAPPGAFLTVQVSDGSGAVPAGAEVEVDGTVLDEIKVDVTSGQVRLGPLPAGCYELKAKADELDEVKLEVCVHEGEELVRSILLVEEDDDGGEDDAGDDSSGRDGG